MYFQDKKEKTVSKKAVFALVGIAAACIAGVYTASKPSAVPMTRPHTKYIQYFQEVDEPEPAASPEEEEDGPEPTLMAYNHCSWERYDSMTWESDNYEDYLGDLGACLTHCAYAEDCVVVDIDFTENRCYFGNDW